MANKPVKTIKLEGRSGTIRLSNVPPNITPKLLPITEEDEAAWLKLDKDRIGIVTSIAANLVFHDRTGNEVNYFSSPITLSYRFGTEDEKRRKGREAELKGKSGKRRAVELVPIFLYQYILDKRRDPKPAFEIWQPFQHFNFNKQTRTVTIKFRFWGDQPIGGGTQP
jgi:hypothetical protein